MSAAALQIWQPSVLQSISPRYSLAGPRLGGVILEESVMLQLFLLLPAAAAGEAEMCTSVSHAGFQTHLGFELARMTAYSTGRKSLTLLDPSW